MDLFGGRDAPLASREDGFGRDEVRRGLERGLAGVRGCIFAVGLYLALKPIACAVDRLSGRIAIDLLLHIHTIRRATPRLRCYRFRRDFDRILKRLLRLDMANILRHRDPNGRTAASCNHAALTAPAPRAIWLLLDRLPAVEYPRRLIAFPRVGANDGGA